ncbi:hypothetical protein V7112_08630 [Bacillus sp. JJ1566]|uniref:hypothetical protein n=1 Tax=Bacillus sp. JJ1566 TaxID=3122961 RepID=UPI002FFE9137
MIEVLKEIQWILGLIIGFFLNRIATKLDRKVQAEKSKEMYYKQYMIYKNQIDLFLKYIQSFVYEDRRDVLTLTRINRTCKYLKEELLKFPLDTIPKDIFLQHRGLMNNLINFQLDTRMELEFKDTGILSFEEKLADYKENYVKLSDQVLEIEKFLS